MVQTTVRLCLTEANLQRAKLAAELEHRSFANFIAHAVLAYLKDKSSNDE